MRFFSTIAALTATVSTATAGNGNDNGKGNNCNGNGQGSNCNTDSPTVSPSTSDQPSSIPSRLPSSIPSKAPSNQPSSIPSRLPSPIPSEAPTNQPSSIPTRLPSSIPSEAPSGQSSSIPSRLPSSIPSKSSQPSSIPSRLPSSTPSKECVDRQLDLSNPTSFSYVDPQTQWDYHVTFETDSNDNLGGTFWQDLPETLIGTYDDSEGPLRFTFTDGDSCGIVNGTETLRSGVVRFIDDCDAVDFTVLSVSETSTCFYEMVVRKPCRAGHLGKEFSIQVDNKLYSAVVDSDEGTFTQKVSNLIGTLTSFGDSNSFDGLEATFENGDSCGNFGFGRSGVVEFWEDCDAEELTVVSVSSPGTCMYEMVVNGLCTCDE